MISSTGLSFPAPHSRGLQAYLFLLCLNPKDPGIATSLSSIQESLQSYDDGFQMFCLFAVDSGIESKQLSTLRLHLGESGMQQRLGFEDFLLAQLVGRQRE